MNLKKPKEQVLSEIQARAAGSVSSHLRNNLGDSLRIDTSSLTYILQNAIAMAVTEGFRTLLENQYTDDDFERDLTLKP